MASEAWKSFPSKRGAVEDLWHDADEHLVAAAVCSRVEELSSAYRRRYDRVQDYYCLYGDPHGKSYETSPVHRNFRNTFAEAIDAKAAELNQDPVWVKVGIKAVGYRAREQARYWEWYSEAAFDRFQLPRLQYVATRDSELANMAAVVICDEPDGPMPMRIHPLDLFIDDAGCIDIEPPELIIRRNVARGYMVQLVQMDESRTEEERLKLVAQLRDAPSAKNGNGRDVLELFEAWMTGYPDDPGRHVQAIKGVDIAIVDEEWDGRPPWAYLVMNPPSQGIWRETLADAARLAPIQLERNKLSQRIRDGLHWETPQLLVMGGLIDDEQLSNQPGENVVETSAPPQGNVLLLEPKGVSDSTYGREATLDEYMYHSIKASQDFARGMEDIKSGTSGRQLKLRRAIANKRLGPEYRQIEEFMERLFRELARGERRAKERISGYKVTVNVSGITKDISAGALELDTDTLQIQVKAASSQSLGPEGDFQDLMDMFETGAISNEEMWQLAKTGDAEKIRRLRVSHLDEIESHIDLILYDNVLLPPPRYLPPKALDMGNRALMRASVDFREDDGTYTEESQQKLAKLRKWVAKVAENLQPPAPALPPVPADVGPAPGAEPGPPPGPPAPPPGPGPAPPPPGAVAPPGGGVITN